MFVLPWLHLRIREIKKMLQFGRKNSRRAWHVIPAQEVKRAGPGLARKSVSPLETHFKMTMVEPSVETWACFFFYTAIHVREF